MADLDLRDSSWVAEQMFLDEDTVEALMAAHDLPGFRVGGKWLVSETKLREFLEEEERRQSAEGLPVTANGVARKHKRMRSRRGGGVTFRLFGNKVAGVTYKAMLVAVLNELGSRDATFFRRFGEEGGRRRRYIAEVPANLYQGRPDLADEYKEQLRDDWWVGTNYSGREIVGLLRRACEVAGISWGSDLIVDEPEDEDRIARAMAVVGIAALDPDASLRHDDLFIEALE